MSYKVRQYLDYINAPNSLLGSSNCRVRFLIPKGQWVVPSSIKAVNVSFNCSNATGSRRFNGQIGVYEPITRLQLSTQQGQLIQECRNVSQLAEVMEMYGQNNAHIDGVKALETGDAVAMSFNSSTSLMSCRRAFGDCVFIDQGLYNIEFNKYLTVLDSLPPVNCGLFLDIEFGNKFANATGAQLGTIVLEYDEIANMKAHEKEVKFLFSTYIPERLYFAAAPTSPALQQQRFLTYTGRKLLSLILNFHDQATDKPVLINNQQVNFFINGAQFVALNGIFGPAEQLKYTENVLGKCIFPWGHLTNLNVGFQMDDSSLTDVLNTTVSNVLALDLHGLAVNEFELQLQGGNTGSAAWSNLYIYMWGKAPQMGVLSPDGNIKIEYV